jgi:hypothetical protein
MGIEGNGPRSFDADSSSEKMSASIKMWKI